ncbi:MAG: stage III sporulation protein AE [Eubacteriales bacterium]|nr:stage III sporulation protein AE [Eubacteriales bacterium]
MTYENLINEQLEAMDLEALEELMGEGGLFNLKITEIISRVLNGESLFQMEGILNSLIGYFLKEVTASISLGVKIVAICILMGMLLHLSSAFGKSGVSTISAMVCSCAVIALCLLNFMEVYKLCGDTIDRMALVMQIILPLLLPLLIAMGSIASGGILNPVILGAVTLFTTIIQKVILPILFFSCVFILGNSLADRDYIKKLAVLLRGFATFLIGLSVTIFSGLTAIQGFVTKSADGMLVKTAKFSVDNFIPIVGGFAADSMDMVLSCTAIIKNSIGVFGLFIIITLVAIPLIKLLAIALVYKITAALVEPIGNKVISDCLNELGNTVITLGVIVFLGALLFIIFLSILISLGTTI